VVDRPCIHMKAVRAVAGTDTRVGEVSVAAWDCILLIGSHQAVVRLGREIALIGSNMGCVDLKIPIRVASAGSPIQAKMRDRQRRRHVEGTCDGAGDHFSLVMMCRV
jgi:hypothetical protein